MRAKPKFCECSRPARVFYNNYWMCVRCRDLAKAAMYQHKVTPPRRQRGANPNTPKP